MIYTIGYAKLTHEHLVRVMTCLRIDRLVDVRAIPWSRKPGWSERALRELLGERYEWAGKELGNKPPRGDTTPEGLERLAARPGTSLLLCLEHAPGECHRHFRIATALPVDVVHIYENELIRADRLQAALDDPDPEATYDFEPAPWANRDIKSSPLT